MIKLSGITDDAFAHPDDISARRLLDKTKMNTLIEWLSDQGAKITLKTYLLGQHIRITQTDMPHLFDLVAQVCDTLDYPLLPQIYTHRSEKFDYKIYVGEHPLIILTDYVLRDFDDDMLCFYLGCAVTALKAKTCQLKIAASFAGILMSNIPVAGQACLPVLASWARKSCYTDDRGGLLACQSISAAERALVRMAGLPKAMIEDARIIEYIEQYRSVSKIAQASQYLQTLNRMEPWRNDRVIELYQWYISGAYDDILETYE